MVQRPTPVCILQVGRAPPTPATTIVEFCKPTSFPVSFIYVSPGSRRSFAQAGPDISPGYARSWGIAGHVRHLPVCIVSDTTQKAAPPGCLTAHARCYLNGLKGLARLGIVTLSFQSVLGSPLLCGNSRSRSQVGNLTSPNSGLLYPSSYIFASPPSSESDGPDPKV